MRFTDRVAVVTGGGRGIGAATVRRFAEQGAAAVIADLDDGPARELAGNIERAGGRALAVHCDVQERTSVEALFKTAVEQVDILVDAQAFSASTSSRTSATTSGTLSLTRI